MEFLNQEEANEYAKTLHPDAKAIVENQKWYVIIPTSYFNKITLDEKLINTPAGELFNQPCEEYANKLAEWAINESIEDYDIDIVAEVYNLKQSIEQQAESLHIEYLKKNKIPVDKKIILENENEDESIQQIAAWLDFKNHAWLQTENRIQAEIGDLLNSSLYK